MQFDNAPNKINRILATLHADFERVKRSEQQGKLGEIPLELTIEEILDSIKWCTEKSIELLERMDHYDDEEIELGAKNIAELTKLRLFFEQIKKFE